MGAKTISQNHRQGYADYDEAKRDILQALGDISKEEIFGRQIICAIYVRPSCSPKMVDGKIVTKEDGTPVYVWQSTGAQEEDIWQGKALLIVAMGPSAFDGDDSYLKATFPNGAPKIGDWVYARPSDGVPMSMMGDGASKPQGTDFKGEPVDKFDWDGWPCRVLQDDSIWGKMSAPHKIV